MQSDPDDPRSRHDELLSSFHARRPGATAQLFARGIFAGDGRSSYEWLREAALAARPSDLLDLACGDGAMLELVRARGMRAPARLIGIDRSPRELAAAAVRAPGAALVRADAGALPLPSASVDAVTCHLALMLFDPIDPCLAEIARVLRPGGAFAFVVGDPFGFGGLWAELLGELRAQAAQESIPLPRLGDARVDDDVHLRALFADAGFDARSLRVEHDTLEIEGDIESAVELLLGTYSAQVIRGEALDALTRRARVVAERAARAGRCVIPIALRRGIIRR